MGLQLNGTNATLRHDYAAPLGYEFTLLIWMRADASCNGFAVSSTTPAAAANRATAAVWLNNTVSPALLNYQQTTLGGSSDDLGTEANQYMGSTLKPVMLVCTSDAAWKMFTPNNPNGRTFNHANDVPADIAALTSLVVGCFSYNGSNSLFFKGSVAEVARWNSSLGATEYATLAGGAKPETVATGSLYEVWSLETYSAGGTYTGLVNNRTLTASGTLSQSALAHPVTRSTAATAVTLSGPTSGTVGTPSINFTVGANGTITGSVTVTPNDSGGGGSFTPTSVTISAGTPSATFTYTPASAGAKTIAVTNDGGLTAPSTITYTASVAAATAVTMTGPTGGATGSPSTNFTLGANGAITGTVVVTPSDGGGGGTFNPTSVSLSSGSPTGTFTYTPSSSGAKTISASNNGGLTNPSTITYTASAAAATAVTMTGPTSGFVGSASTNFTVGANGAITGSVTITPSDGGGGGSFSPASVVISAGTPTATFTYTPGTTGAKTISVSNNGGLTAPSTITYTSNAVGTITGAVLSDEVGNSQVGVVVPKVVFMRVSDMTVQLALSNQTVNGSGQIPVSNAALIPGVLYLRILCNADGTKVGAQAFTAA